jgi:hypothetical protein
MISNPGHHQTFSKSHRFTATAPPADFFLPLTSYPVLSLLGQGFSPQLFFI